ncbi:MAG: Fic family protein, partial [Spirochaetales bacterium]|nr:Fic family protein [Spirochaetales bacterium]
EALCSSRIEGLELNVDSVYSSVAKRLDLDYQGKEFRDPYSAAVSEVVMDAVLDHSPMSKDRICDWNRKLLENPKQHRQTHLPKAGHYRTGPVYVMSGNAFKGEAIEYEGVPSERVATEMQELIDWMNSDREKSSVVKSAIASFWFVSIHPFGDGNGRISRALADYELSKAEAVKGFKYFSVSKALSDNRNLYYGHLKLLQNQSSSMDITKWILWYIDTVTFSVLEATAEFERTIRLTQLMASRQFLDLNARQNNMVYRLLSGTFFGKLTAEKYRKIERCESATATRDLSDLVGRGILVRSESGGRSTSYSLNPEIDLYL